MRMNRKALCSFTLLVAASEVEVDSNKVTSVEFAGKTAALDFK